MIEKKNIYVYLLDEGTDVWRPIEAVPVGDDVYRIVSENPYPEDEHWQFSAGDLVRCELKPLSERDDYQNKLVSVEKIAEKST
jgi:hypothetical protein